MMPKPLGRLQKVDLREAWLSEAADSTPWLPQAENLKLLGEGVGEENFRLEHPNPRETSSFMTADLATILATNCHEPEEANSMGKVMIVNESTVEEAALSWLGEPDYPVLHWPQIAPREFSVGLFLKKFGASVSPPKPQTDRVSPIQRLYL